MPRVDLHVQVGKGMVVMEQEAARRNDLSAQFEDDLGAQHIPDALTLDVSATLPVTRTLALEARGENLTDEEVVAGISGAGIIERATPRTLWLGLRWQG